MKGYRRYTLPQFLFWIAYWCFVISMLVLLIVNSFGCSAVEAIGKDTTNIQTLAQSSESRFVAIKDLTNDKQIEEHAQQGEVEQQDIQDLAKHIVARLPQVEDRTPAWLDAMKWLAIAGIAIATFLILWQTGIGSLVRKLLYSFSLFIPSSKKREVEMDMKVADSDNHMTYREMIAYKRSDPAYESAYKMYWKDK